MVALRSGADRSSFRWSPRTSESNVDVEETSERETVTLIENEASDDADESDDIDEFDSKPPEEERNDSPSPEELNKPDPPEDSEPT